MFLAAKRVNKPPKAIVRPTEQTIQLPTHTAIVDASDSSDDATKDLKFKWELVVNPVGYVGAFDESSATLTLSDLIAGNYTVKVSSSSLPLLWFFEQI